MRRFIDLSIYLENDVVSDPPPMRPNIDYIRHDTGAEQMAEFFPGLDKSELPDGEGWAVEMVQLCTHNGTHLDAPYHYHSTMNDKLDGAERAITIDEVPLEWCFYFSLSTTKNTALCCWKLKIGFISWSKATFKFLSIYLQSMMLGKCFTNKMLPLAWQIPSIRTFKE